MYHVNGVMIATTAHCRNALSRFIWASSSWWKQNKIFQLDQLLKSETVFFRLLIEPFCFEFDELEMLERQMDKPPRNKVSFQITSFELKELKITYMKPSQTNPKCYPKTRESFHVDTIQRIKYFFKHLGSPDELYFLIFWYWFATTKYQIY